MIFDIEKKLDGDSLFILNLINTKVYLVPFQ